MVSYKINSKINVSSVSAQTKMFLKILLIITQIHEKNLQPYLRNLPNEVNFRT